MMIKTLKLLAVGIMLLGWQCETVHANPITTATFDFTFANDEASVSGSITVLASFPGDGVSASLFAGGDLIGLTAVGGGALAGLTWGEFSPGRVTWSQLTGGSSPSQPTDFSDFNIKDWNVDGGDAIEIDAFARKAFVVKPTTLPPNPDSGLFLISFGPASTVPEPATITLMGLGLVGLGGYHYRRRRKNLTHS